MLAYRETVEFEHESLIDPITPVTHTSWPIIGDSEALEQTLRQLHKVAPTDATVLICGETGTGKELVAQAVHERSGRTEGPLVKVNCAAISAGLVESELFGHERGAFTGAVKQHAGRFEAANGGTLFLDEVGELPMDTQVKLLRVLQEGQFERVGSNRSISVDVRIIAATNRDLEQSVEAGEFRADLLFRLNVFPINVPPLRQRVTDIPLLADHFLTKVKPRLGKQLKGFSRPAMKRLMRYPWPGNVRELENVVERAAIMADGPVIEFEDTCLVPAKSAASSPVTGSSLATLESAERNHIIAALEQTNWMISGDAGAAILLDINPNTLRSRMKKLGIKRSIRAD